MGQLKGLLITKNPDTNEIVVSIPLYVDDNSSRPSVVLEMDTNYFRDVVKDGEISYQEFMKGIDLFSEPELYDILMLREHELIKHLHLLVNCNGCRRGIFDLCQEIQNHPGAMSPLVKQAGGFNLGNQYLSNKRLLYETLYCQSKSARLEQCLQQAGKILPGRRCALHGYETLKQSILSIITSQNLMDLWDSMPIECRVAIATIEMSTIQKALDEYYREHSMCKDCGKRIKLALTDAIKGVDILDKEKSLVKIQPNSEKKSLVKIQPNSEEKSLVKIQPNSEKQSGDAPNSEEQSVEKKEPEPEEMFNIFDYFEYSNNQLLIRHKRETIDNLMMRGITELCGCRKGERHAPTTEQAQDELVTCIGICLVNSLSTVFQRQREEESNWQVLMAVANKAIRQAYEVAVYMKTGHTQLELICGDSGKEEEKKKRQREKKQRKRMKKAAEQAAKMAEDAVCTENQIMEPAPIKQSNVAQKDLTVALLEGNKSYKRMIRIKGRLRKHLGELIPSWNEDSRDLEHWHSGMSTMPVTVGFEKQRAEWKSVTTQTIEALILVATQLHKLIVIESKVMNVQEVKGKQLAMERLVGHAGISLNQLIKFMDDRNLDNRTAVLFAARILKHHEVNYAESDCSEGCSQSFDDEKLDAQMIMPRKRAFSAAMSIDADFVAVQDGYKNCAKMPYNSLHELLERSYSEEDDEPFVPDEESRALVKSPVIIRKLDQRRQGFEERFEKFKNDNVDATPGTSSRCDHLLEARDDCNQCNSENVPPPPSGQQPKSRRRKRGGKGNSAPNRRYKGKNRR